MNITDGCFVALEVTCNTLDLTQMNSIRSERNRQATTEAASHNAKTSHTQPRRSTSNAGTARENQWRQKRILSFDLTDDDGDAEPGVVRHNDEHHEVTERQAHHVVYRLQNVVFYPEEESTDLHVSVGYMRNRERQLELFDCMGRLVTSQTSWGVVFRHSSLVCLFCVLPIETFEDVEISCSNCCGFISLGKTGKGSEYCVSTHRTTKMRSFRLTGRIPLKPNNLPSLFE